MKNLNAFVNLTFLLISNDDESTTPKTTPKYGWNIPGILANGYTSDEVTTDPNTNKHLEPRLQSRDSYVDSLEYYMYLQFPFVQSTISPYYSISAEKTPSSKF